MNELGKDVAFLKFSIVYLFFSSTICIYIPFDIL